MKVDKPIITVNGRGDFIPEISITKPSIPDITRLKPGDELVTVANANVVVNANAVANANAFWNANYIGKKLK